MTNKRGKAVDTTFLSPQHATERGFIHRDYLAHCLRWSHVVKWLTQHRRYQTAHVLDVGCGKEAPLAGVMFTSRMTHTTGSYTGVDYGPIEPHVKLGAKFKHRLFPKTDFAYMRNSFGAGGYDLITSFEMLEHVEPMHSYMTLVRIRECLKKKGTAFISTPCYSRKMGAADNHVNEMSVDGLHWLIERAGLRVVDGWGTFASQADYKSEMQDYQRWVWDHLIDYYDSNVLACFMAPMFPFNSRNAIWEVMIDSGDEKRTDMHLTLGKAPTGPEHSSSDKWDAALKKIEKFAKQRGFI